MRAARLAFALPFRRIFSHAGCTGESPWMRQPATGPPPSVSIPSVRCRSAHRSFSRRVKSRTSASNRMADRTSSRCCISILLDQPDRIYLHSGPASRTLRQLASGIPVCVTVTQLDGLVYSRDAKYHSANYRCVMCFGRGRIFENEETKRAMFEAMTQRYFPGRTAGRDYTPAPSSHLTSTAVVEVTHRRDQRQDARRRAKGPQDGDEDAPGTCGVAGSLTTPYSITRYSARHRARSAAPRVARFQLIAAPVSARQGPLPEWY